MAQNNKKGDGRILIITSIVIVIMAIAGVIAFLHWQSSFQEAAEDTAEHVEDTVTDNSKVLVDILREDINAVEAELECKDNGGAWVNGACIMVEDTDS